MATVTITNDDNAPAAAAVATAPRSATLAVSQMLGAPILQKKAAA
jgi:hypothetical protein